MERVQVIKNLNKLSKHYALSDEWQELCRQAAILLEADEKEILFLKRMEKEMARGFTLEELGRIAQRNLGTLK